MNSLEVNTAFVRYLNNNLSYKILFPLILMVSAGKDHI